MEIDGGHAPHRLLTVGEGGEPAAGAIWRQSPHGPSVDLCLHALGVRGCGVVQPVLGVESRQMHGRGREGRLTVRGHETESVIGVQVRDEYVVDLFGADSGGAEVLQQMTGAWSEGCAGARIDQHCASARLEEEGVHGRQKVAVRWEESVSQELGDPFRRLAVHVGGEDGQRAVVDGGHCDRTDAGARESRGLG